jgi:aminoglycoside phosphotransferase family enzyme
MSDKVIVTGETISRVAEMIAAHNAKVAALEAELELTRQALNIAAKEIARYHHNGQVCIDVARGDCPAIKKCPQCNPVDCVTFVTAWAMEKAKEQS